MTSSVTHRLSFTRIGASILSHHVDDFSLVSAFFLFSIGCLNMFLGLVFRESAKEKRALASWRSDSKAALPTYNPKLAGTASFLSSTYADDKGRHSDDFAGGSVAEKAGYGFGRQGEKAAGLKGTFCHCIAMAKLVLILTFLAL
jgi:hypothetical protein